MKSIGLKVVVLAVMVLGASASLAGDYLPLEVGNWWHYVSTSGFPEYSEISEMETILGWEVYVLAHSIGGGDPYLRNFWTIGDNGKILLHGYDRGTFGFMYDPPIVAFDPSVAVGDSWTSTFDAFSYLDGSLVLSGEATYMIFETGVYEVEAGSFPATAVGEIDNQLLRESLRGFTLEGQPLPEPTREARYWYSENVGLIKYLTIDGMVTLDNYFGNNVPTTSNSLEGIKALYR